MNFFPLLRVEAGRLFRSRLTLISIIITAISPFLGLWLYRLLGSNSDSASYVTSLTGTVIGDPALFGALFGAVIFSFLTASELHRRQRCQTEAITNAICSVFRMNLAQTISLLAAAAISQLVTLFVCLPYAVTALGSVFSLKMFLSLYLSVMLPALCFAVLFTSAAYQTTHHFDLTLFLFAAFCLLSLLVWAENWLLRWVNPAIAYLSDNFGNIRKIMSICYNRLFWLLILSGFWTLSFLGIRRYGKGFSGSLRHNLRRIYIPVIAVVLAASGGFVYAAQPFLDHSPAFFDSSGNIIHEGEAVVSCSAIHIDARPNLRTGRFYGTAAYTLQNPSGETQALAFKINPGYKIFSAAANGEPAVFRDDNQLNMNDKVIEVDIPAETEVELVLEYGGFPQEWNTAALRQGEAEISRDYVYLAGSQFLPIPTNLDDREVSLTADIDLPDGMIPVLFGMGTEENMGASSAETVRWRLEKSGAGVVLYAGDYVSHSIEAGGISVEFYYSEKHSRVLEEYDVDSVIKNVFEYCTERYGSLSFMMESMKLVTIGSQAVGNAAAGASTVPEENFNENRLNDPLKGAGGAEVLAHEIIHQWWGVGNVFDSMGENDAWSSEGLTTYSTYRLMKELHGEEYAVTNYIDVWQRGVASYYDNFYIRNPEYLDALPETYLADITNSLTPVKQYCLMPLMLLKAEELVGGEAAFDAILYEMSNRGHNEDFSYVNLSYELFLEYCGLTMEDLDIEQSLLL